MEADVKQQMGARPPVQRPHGSPSASVAFRFRPREKKGPQGKRPPKDRFPALT